MDLVEDVKAEFHGAALGDRRLEKRATQIAARLAVAPANSFPRLVEDGAELEALYRFFRNPSVTPERLLGPHQRATLTRCRTQSVVRVSHDTTTLNYRGDRDGLGTVGKGNGKGFHAHVALAIGEGEDRSPLGVAGLMSFSRRARERSPTPTAETYRLRTTPRTEKESARWMKSVHAAEKTLTGVSLVHVMDQEADDYVLLAELVASRARFVVRGSSKRLLSRRSHAVEVELEGCVSRVFRTVAIASRSKAVKSHPARQERNAHLSIRATRIRLHAPQFAQSDVPFIDVNVVQVFEPSPPEGEPAVQWTLYTTEPITTPTECEAIVDHYRARWRIEEFFRALKSGCAIESRQLTDFNGLTRALAMFAPIAWRLLTMRVLSREEHPPPAHALFSDDDLVVIRHLAEKRKHRVAANPSVRDVMLALAAVGGHLKRNGDPGWVTIGRGYDDFSAARQGFEAAIAAMKAKL